MGEMRRLLVTICAMRARADVCPANAFCRRPMRRVAQRRRDEEAVYGHLNGFGVDVRVSEHAGERRGVLWHIGR